MRKKESNFMNEKELARVILAHLLTEDEEFVKAYKENPPQVATNLQWQPGEGIISELSKKDLIQLASRYANDLSVYVKNILHFELRIERLLTWLCEAQGIDVKAKFKEDAKAKEQELQERIEKSKEDLEKSNENK